MGDPSGRPSIRLSVRLFVRSDPINPCVLYVCPSDPSILPIHPSVHPSASSVRPIRQSDPSVRSVALFSLEFLVCVLLAGYS
jgi:hypothetical protein